MVSAIGADVAIAAYAAALATLLNPLDLFLRHLAFHSLNCFNSLSYVA